MIQKKAMNWGRENLGAGDTPYPRKGYALGEIGGHPIPRLGQGRSPAPPVFIAFAHVSGIASNSSC